MLGIGSCFFNDPLVAINTISPNKVSMFFSIFSILLFVSMLFLFWMVMLDRIDTENDQRNTNTLTLVKILSVAAYFILSMVSALLVAYLYMDNPGFNFNEDYPVAFQFLKSSVLVYNGCIVAYLIYKLVRVVMNWKTKLRRH
jgi:NADH:ubiquinone oxidoreductase subunit 6 (subunit J)